MKASETLRRSAVALRNHKDEAVSRLATDLDVIASRLERLASEVKFNRYADEPTPTSRELLTTIGELP